MSDHMSIIYLGEANFAPDNVCIYCHFDYDNTVDEYVFCVLQNLQSCDFDIIFVTACSELDGKSSERLKRNCKIIMQRENSGLDFGGWADAINAFPSVLEAENLLLANDSVYGSASSYQHVFDAMKRHEYEFWGITESYQIKPHLQSYFVNYTKPVLRSDVFREFWVKYQSLDDKQEIIDRYEVGMTELLGRAGFSYGSLLGESGCLRSAPGISVINPSHHLWDLLIKRYRAPFIKIELIRDNPYCLALDSVNDLLSEFGWNLEVMDNHQSRVQHRYKKADVSEGACLLGKKVASDINEYVKISGAKKNNSKSTSLLSSKSRKLSILYFAFRLPLFKPKIFLKLCKHVIWAGFKTLKDDLVAAYHSRNFGGPLSLPSTTLFEYRLNKCEPTRKAVNEVDCFAMKQFHSTGRYAVVCHIFYEELYEELSEIVKRVPGADIFFSLVEGFSDALESRIKEDFPQGFVQVFPNHGRDVYPFVKYIESGLLYNYQAVLKIHGKLSRNEKSGYDFDGERWRKDILGNLVPKANVGALLERFTRSRDAGMLCHKDYIYGKEHMGANEPNLQMLCATLGMTFNRRDLQFPAGTMFWIKPWILSHIDALSLTADDFEPEPLIVDGVLPHALERFIGVATLKSGYRIYSPDMLSETRQEKRGEDRVDLVAFYLPQFHPVPENDQWWGKGFTEWRNVGKARPAFHAHYQPRIPEELGYYDLRMSAVLEQQSKLAESYGLTAFAFYHYWFSGDEKLAMPIRSFRDNKDIDFKYLLCWANENWTRSWDGLSRDVLLSQEYEAGWATEYAKDTAQYLISDNYYRRNNKPVLLIYNVSAIPNCASSVRSLRETYRALGVGEVEIIAVRFYGVEDDAGMYGVDGFSEFPPHRLDFIGMGREMLSGIDRDFEGNVYSYEAVAAARIAEINSGIDTDLELGVMCGWDNTARRNNNPDIFHGATPGAFRSWLKVAYEKSIENSSSDKNAMLFINAWNEWAEGAYLEPDIRYRRAFLDAVKSVKINT